ncbi:DUF1203 domain-containing protein [Nocardioides sp. cx-173]|uniref:DUF1203 domain-containing protein n=1 Tax=Nocardioides sp. cx-173 TaxID=2898796 RepID=UPI001E3F8204|nr:DUF1203 domain-containing protein [Nocardioides sp. cx-173]MCD4525470.1 DUF1203 domain-containing protein [Nocardioides sp. cx-173]UGB42616.1 DUF1203 domain-containing protein [Nocardioides sp. cx-173]
MNTDSSAVRSPVPFTLRLIDPDLLASWRAEGRPSEDVAALVASGGERVRCCLRDAAAGERLLLVSYSPPLPAPSPYAETGAVFVHAEECEGPERLDRFPLSWEGRPQVLRAYDERGCIHPATRVHEHGPTHDAVATLLAEPGVVEVHSRNLAYGCFMVAAKPR